MPSPFHWHRRHATENPGLLAVRRKPLAGLVPIAVALLGGAGALPSGGHFVAGWGSISGSATSLTINQTTSRGVIDGSHFSIGGGNRVTFANGNGATLNRVTGGDPSAIYGTLSATGSVYLINSGIIDWSKSTGIVTALYDMNGAYTPGTMLANPAWAASPYSGHVAQITGWRPHRSERSKAGAGPIRRDRHARRRAQHRRERRIGRRGRLLRDRPAGRGQRERRIRYCSGSSNSRGGECAALPEGSAARDRELGAPE